MHRPATLGVPSARAARGGEFAVGWKPLTAAVVGVACGASPVPFNVLPLVMGPIHAELGWDFADISAGMMIFGVIASLLAPVFGGLADRFGVRVVALASLAAFIVTFAALYFTPASVGGYWALWALLGVVGIGSTPVTFSRAISIWFYRNRGLALAIMLLGTSAAALVVPQLAQSAIGWGGWRLAFPVVALLPLVLALPLCLAWFREPRPQERPAGITNERGEIAGIALAQALRGYRFWLLLAAVFVIAFAYAGAHIHIAEIVQLHGFTPRVGASALGIIAAGILASRLFIGYLFDRLWAPAVACAALLLSGAGCWLLTGTTPSLTRMVAGAFLIAFSAGAESDVVAFFAAKYFGMAHYGRIYGLLYMAFGIGASLSPVAYGMVRDRSGGYDAMLMLALVLFALAGGALLLLGRYPAFESESRPSLTPAAVSE
jgi:MFS family permease